MTAAADTSNIAIARPVLARLSAPDDTACCSPQRAAQMASAINAVAAAIREANRAREEGKETVILFNLSGHGIIDLKGYDMFMKGELTDYELPVEEIEKNLKSLKDFPKPAPLPV